MTQVRMVRAHPAAVHSKYDVLMDGFTWFTGIRHPHEALQIAFELVEQNPEAIVQVRKIETLTTLTDCYLGEPEPSFGRVMS